MRRARDTPTSPVHFFSRKDSKNFSQVLIIAIYLYFALIDKLALPSSLISPGSRPPTSPASPSKPLTLPSFPALPSLPSPYHQQTTMFGSAKKRRGLSSPSSPSSPAAFAERSPPTTPKADDNDDDKYAPKKEVVVLQSPASQDMEFRKEAERLERVLSKFADQGEGTKSSRGSSPLREYDTSACTFLPALVALSR